MSEHLEYNRDTNPYPSFGKKYNGEKAIISMTSWAARISTCSKTIFSLLKQCPGFHIVLVLSEEEFPKMMDELPENLRLFVDNELIEVLWVYKNYKSLKKVLFTMDKYRTVPIISADDDLEYICNYADELYKLWLTDKTKICTINAPEPYHTNGTATLYFPNCFGESFLQELFINKHLKIYENADDGFMEVLRFKHNVEKINYLKPHIIWKAFIESKKEPLHYIYGKQDFFNYLRIIQSEDVGFNIKKYI